MIKIIADNKVVNNTKHITTHNGIVECPHGIKTEKEFFNLIGETEGKVKFNKMYLRPYSYFFTAVCPIK